MRPGGSYDVPLNFQRTLPAKQTGDTVFQCRHCYAPVVDSQAGRQGHRERLGHWPEERKRA